MLPVNYPKPKRISGFIETNEMVYIELYDMCTYKHLQTPKVRDA